MTNNFENENNDDFIESEGGAPGEKKPGGGMAGNLSEAWRTRPMFKFMVLLVAVFAVGVAALNFLGGESGNETARLGKPPSLHEAPGGSLSPYMKQQTELANSERSQQALASGGSAMPTMIGQTAEIEPEKKDDPLKELRVETENLKKQVQQQQVQVQQQQQQQVQVQQQIQQKPPTQFDDSLAQAMQHQMQQLTESWKPTGIKSVLINKADEQKGDQGAAAGAGQSAAANALETAPAKIVVNAGTVSYAQLLTEANSDVPGPIMAQIVSGPLAGARAIGGFQVSEGYEKYLVLKFSIADKKGKDYRINAIALDPDTTLGGMATEVDERYFVRVVLPAAAGFLQGVGQAIGQGGSSITTNGTTSISTVGSNGWKQGMYNGMGVAAQTMGQFFQNQANLTKPLVRVAAGTPMGIFFISPVEEPAASGTVQQQEPANRGGAANGGYNNGNGYNNNYNNASYPGTTVSGFGNAQQNMGGVPYPNYATPGASYGRSSAISPMSGFSMPSYGGTQIPSYNQNYGQ